MNNSDWRCGSLPAILILCRDFVVKMKEDLKDITASRTSVSEGGEEFYNSRVSSLKENYFWKWKLSD